jgi:signal transduction histidine kinase
MEEPITATEHTYTAEFEPAEEGGYIVRFPSLPGLVTEGESLEEARSMAERNVGSLRDEIVSLGPYGLEDLTLDAALEQCGPVWARRFGVPVQLDLERLDLPNDICGSLFGIAQEAVANAGRHARASTVTVSVRGRGDAVELRVVDDGHGFPERDPFAREDPSHIGLATMRERAELAGGTLVIETGDAGTTVRVRVPVNGMAREER